MDNINNNEIQKPRVVVEVTGGVAEVTYADPNVDVSIVDHDNAETETTGL